MCVSHEWIYLDRHHFDSELTLGYGKSRGSSPLRTVVVNSGYVDLKAENVQNPTILIFLHFGVAFTTHCQILYIWRVVS